MNDPFDCLAQIPRTFSTEVIAAFRERIKGSKSRTLKIASLLNDQDVQKFMNVSRTEMIEKYAFCALSEKFDDVLMWSYYANGHKGIVVGFEFDNFPNPAVYQKVNYKDELEDYDLLKWADFMNGDDDDTSLLLKDISIKSSQWAHEKEWRVWQEKPGYTLYKPSAIKKVFFGLKCPEDVKKVVVELLNSDLPDDFLYTEMEFRNDPLRLDEGEIIKGN